MLASLCIVYVLLEALVVWHHARLHISTALFTLSCWIYWYSVNESSLPGIADMA